MTEFEVDEEYITENTPIEAMTNDELLKKRDYIYGTYRNKNYLNQIDQEIKDRGLGSPSWQQDDAEYEKQFEVNTSYDQDKEIGSIPSAYFAHSQPMNAKNGGDEKFESIDQQKWYYATDQTYLDDEPHENRKVKGEKLNKDGTGVRRATRGLNPKKTKAKVLQFVYVSKSECEICRQYDGMAFATDSPNRPIIPRLESQGKKGTRPYTHPNCKCKWVRPFSDAGIKNFDDMGLFDDGNKSFGYSGEAEANELKQKTIDMARQTIVDFDKLSKRDQYVAIAHMFKERLSSPESFDPTSLPIASMIKMTYDAIEPTLALRLAKMTHRDSNEVRDLIDDMVGESLSSERKHEIVLDHNLDFTFENLLDLTVTALSEVLNEEEKIGMDVELEFTDDEKKAKDTVEDHLDEDPEHYSRLKSVFEHDVWDEKTNTLVDPSLLEDKSESDEGEFGFTDDEWNHFPKKIQDQLTTKVFKKEGLDDEEQYMPDVYNIDPYPHRHEFIDNVCIICDYVLKASEDYDDHSCPTCPDKPYDCCCLYCDTDITQYGSYDCKNCGRTKGNMHYGESKATESLETWWNKNDREFALNEIGADISLIDTEWYNLPDKVREDIMGTFRNAYGMGSTNDYKITTSLESKATEGGRGSGRKGHQKWMLGAEADPEECPNCMILTEKKNGKCQICGNSY